MTVTILDGDIFEFRGDAIANPVNCVGVESAGLAKEFKWRFPTNSRSYRLACQYGVLRLGRVYITGPWATPPYYIVNFPTKHHWRDASDLRSIVVGLADLRIKLEDCGIKSVALPALGCGLGGLRQADVIQAIQDAFKRSPAAITVYRKGD